MIRKLTEAFALFLSHWVLFSLIVLTVELPVNIFLNHLSYHIYSDDPPFGRVFRISSWLYGILSPIYVGAMIYAAGRIKKNESIAYLEAMAVGLRNWIRLLCADLVAYLIISAGLLAFVIPGVILAVRYALIGSVVIFEGAAPAQSRRRSTELTRGKRW